MRAAAGGRPLLAHALEGDTAALASALRPEEQGEREPDRACWAPFCADLEQLRTRRRG